MYLVYFSTTGNIKRFIAKLDQNYFQQLVGTQNLKVDQPVIIITPTVGFGQIPDDVEQFCNSNKPFIKYVIASGNRNWGHMFANSGDLIATRYHATLLYKFELSGTSSDVESVKRILETIYKDHN